MKRCPVCQKEYYDETLGFCLDDGSKLLKVDRINNEILTVETNKPALDLTNSKTVQFPNQKDGNAPDFVKPETRPNKQISEKTEIIKKNLTNSTQKFLEISPIVFALAHNYWQWLYLYRQPAYQLTAFFTSYNFLIWIFLLFGGLMFGLFSLKYGKNKGFAVTALVVLAINVILSIVPK